MRSAARFVASFSRHAAGEMAAQLAARRTAQQACQNFSRFTPTFRLLMPAPPFNAIVSYTAVDDISGKHFADDFEARCCSQALTRERHFH